MSPAPASGNEAGSTPATAVRAAGPGPAPTLASEGAPAPRTGLGSRRRAVQVARYAPILGPAAVMLAFGLWGLGRDASMGNDEVAR
ncbi:MAG: hypothetical protein ACRDOK_05650 [Streptosporangiaceae bacterium]